MLVRRVDVSFLVSIQRDSRVTGAKAISSSLAGSGPGSVAERTNRSRDEATLVDAIGVQRVAGDTSGSGAIFRGPVRRSAMPAIVFDQVAAAIDRSAAVIWTCASFSASAKVVGETAGPADG